MPKAEEFGPPKKSNEMKGCHACLLIITMILVIIAVIGPVYAFTVTACVSTSSCRIVGLLGLSGAYCAEGPGEESQYLMHGEKCSVVCPAGLVASVPVLSCDDGVTLGAEEFKCGEPPPPPPDGNKVGGLIQGAITGGEIRTACRRATKAGLKCKGAPGGTAILMQLPDLTDKLCKELLTECRLTNGEFEWMQFTVDPNTKPTPDPKIFGPQDPPTGLCHLGCWNEMPPQTDPPTYAPIVGNAITKAEEKPASALLCGGPDSPNAPICFEVSGSCNYADNGDYYRQLPCAAGLPQWATETRSHRVRYDDKPTTGQGGKWVLESEFGKDSTLNTYGELSARQDTFGLLPKLLMELWTFQCKVPDGWDELNVIRTLPLTLKPCTCTRQFDCSGNGKAEGDKLKGPNCVCRCDEGWTGKHCNLALCRSPQIFRAKVVACEEGEWIYANKDCTPACEEGYKATEDKITCLGDASAFTPPLFYCIKKDGGPNLAALAAQQYVGTTTKPPPCSELDCSFRGTPTSDRNSAGECICKCIPNYIGVNCGQYSGQCPAPMVVENGDAKTCYEGTIISTVCTAQCLPTYWPVPLTLTCSPGTNRLEPEVFQCFGGPPVSATWCELMQGISIGTSAIAVIVLILICIHEAPSLKRKPASFIIGLDLMVDMEQDEEGGEHYIVRSAGKEWVSNLPDRIKDSVMECDLQTGTDHVTGTHSRDYDHAKHVLQEQRYRRGDITVAIGDEVVLHPDEELGSEIDEEHEKKLRRLADAAYGIEESPQVAGSLMADIRDNLGIRRGSMRAQTPGTRQQTPGTRPTTKQSNMLADGTYEFDLESSQESSNGSFQGPDPGTQLAIGLPGYIAPEEPEELHMGWHLQYHALEEECQKKRYEEAHDAHSKNISEETRHQIEFEERINAAIEETHQEREDAEDAMQAALAAGDGEALKVALVTTKAVLAKLTGAPVAITNMLSRLIKIGEGRYEQYFEKNDKHKAHMLYLDRIKAGKAADWHMTSDELWVYAEDGNLAAVNSGIKAFLPVLTRSADGKRRTMLHMACKPACVEAQQAIAAAASRAAAAARLQTAAGAIAAARAASAATATTAVGSNAKPQRTEVAVGDAETADSHETGIGDAAAGYASTPMVAVSLGPDGAAGEADAPFVPVGGVDEGAADESVFEPDPPVVVAEPEFLPDIGIIEVGGPSAEEAEFIANSRISIIKALLAAKASPNTGDCWDVSPFDLAVSEGGPGAENLPILQKLKELGLMPFAESAAIIKQEAIEKAREAGGSRLSGHTTAKAKAKGVNPATQRVRKR